MSRRDGAIVARHEVPGTAPPQESRVGVGRRRVGVGGQVQETAIASFPIRGPKWARIQLSVSTRCHRDTAKACLKMSCRDDAIVAWREVPGRAPTQKIRPLGPEQARRLAYREE